MDKPWKYSKENKIATKGQITTQFNLHALFKIARFIKSEKEWWIGAWREENGKCQSIDIKFQTRKMRVLEICGNTLYL